ncbi:MAG: tRNA preQ1(34) S-adenosylmethionine ribosyltransferase-isomerase QueA, partial [Pseudomonadota bacterium]
MSTDLSVYDFELPEANIALRPVEPQDAARLLVVHGDGRLEDAGVRDLPRYLSAGDVMVFNDTRVIPAALKGVRAARDENGHDIAVDANLVERVDAQTWRALARPGKRLKVGDRIAFGDGFDADVVGKLKSGETVLKFAMSGLELDAALDRFGAMPLPPYIARKRAADAKDRETYQTSFAGNEAKSVAAPTAGLHFTPRLLGEIDVAGIAREQVRLHVGLGTFAPLKDEQIEAGRLHEEWRRVTPEVAAKLNTARAGGKRCVAVGTTALRTLESAATPEKVIEAVTGPTDIFLMPGYEFRATDALVTNFHLPKSSLFMLVCALMGTDVMQAAYAHAVRETYRFYSYG